MSRSQGSTGWTCWSAPAATTGPGSRRWCSGVEGAGTVLRRGRGVTDFAVGDRVVAMGETNKPGFYAERAVVPVDQVVPVPDAVDLPSAAALPTAWLSAWYCLRRLADIQPGETLLVNAGGQRGRQRGRADRGRRRRHRHRHRRIAGERPTGSRLSVPSTCWTAPRSTAQALLDEVGRADRRPRRERGLRHRRRAGVRGQPQGHRLRGAGALDGQRCAGAQHHRHPRLLPEERADLRVSDHRAAGARLRPAPRPDGTAGPHRRRSVHRADRRDLPARAGR